MKCNLNARFKKSGCKDMNYSLLTMINFELYNQKEILIINENNLIFVSIIELIISQ